MARELTDIIEWRVHLASPRAKVFDAIATDEGRSQFWAAEAPEIEGSIRFKFGNGMVFEDKVLDKRRPERFAVEYFARSKVQFDLLEDGNGGTDLTMTETDVPEANRMVHLPGWISVLLALKAAVDFSIDIRNNDPTRTWDQGYVDV